jgi:hypothetical protein
VHDSKQALPFLRELRFGHRVQLKAANKVVGEHAELPRTVGPVMVRRHDTQGKRALVFGKGLSPRRPRPRAKAHRAASPRGMFAATAEYL